MPATPETCKGAAMTRDLVARNKPVFDQLHPNIYRIAIGLVVWFVLAAWVFFDRGGPTGLPLAFVTVLLLIAVGLTLVLSRVWRNHPMPREPQLERLPFHDWRRGEFAVWGSRLRSMHAAIDILLPFVAAAVGMTAIGIVFAVVAATST
jgi:hypothetical protein